jgi:hypothetical protein
VPLAGDQDWCLQCGAGAPDSLTSRTPTWRSAAVIVTTLAVLVAGAAGAAYAALSKGAGKAKLTVTTVAQVAAPAASAPATPVPGVATTPKIGAPTTIKPVIPLPKAAKIPLTPSVTPTPSIKLKPLNPVTGAGGEPAPTTSTPKSSKETPAPVGESHPEALMLDTNAAQTYNPYNYPATNFGDPSLAIDGDPTTGWTALVEPSVAPKMAEGLVIDLNTPRKLSAATLVTSTPGMTVQVYGSSAATLPTSITDPAWVALTPSFASPKRNVKIKFNTGHGADAVAVKRAYRFITLWISRAPVASVGTPQAPGHVTVDELELFPAK